MGALGGGVGYHVPVTMGYSAWEAGSAWQESQGLELGSGWAAVPSMCLHQEGMVSRGQTAACIGHRGQSQGLEGCSTQHVPVVVEHYSWGTQQLA